MNDFIQLVSRRILAPFSVGSRQFSNLVYEILQHFLKSSLVQKSRFDKVLSAVDAKIMEEYFIVSGCVRWLTDLLSLMVERNPEHAQVIETK